MVELNSQGERKMSVVMGESLSLWAKKLKQWHPLLLSQVQVLCIFKLQEFDSTKHSRHVQLVVYLPEKIEDSQGNVCASTKCTLVLFTQVPKVKDMFTTGLLKGPELSYFLFLWCT